jgi:asparagine synthase (glutamine-hydrolysing)
MCGIAGFISATVGPVDREAAVQRMNMAMQRRGPDDDGIGSWGEATLGMRRLAIFDPANGHQPMSTADGRWQIVFNGAIYNFRELRRELEAAGRTFRTECDTEILLGAIAHWGEAALPRLRGMFAFAAWDTLEGRLLMARDPFGIKPLYYRAGVDGSLLFASELNALLASGRVAAEIDPAAASSYLSWLAVPAPQTIYRGIHSLRPGERATWQKGWLKLAPGWSLREARADPGATCSTRPAFIAGLRERLDDSIRAHSLADVPVGAFLSGGLDSTAVVALMTRIGGSRLKTFSLGFDEAGYSEAEEAAANARFLGAEHHPTVVTGRQAAADIGALMAALDQPTGDGINTWYASQAARAGGVTVALSGLGADEIFGGYPAFNDVPGMTRWLPAWQALPGPLRKQLLRRWERGDERWRKLADSLRHGHGALTLALLRRRVFAEPDRRALLNADLPYAPHPEEAQMAAELGDDREPLDAVSVAELRGYMADVLLRDSDTMSMRHSLELRVPYVDRPLIEWLWQQPAAWRMKPAGAKTALAEAVADLLPPGMAHRGKRGFTLPLAVWMKKDLRPFLDDTFSPGNVNRSGLFAPGAVERQWRGFLAGNDSRAWSRVWSLAILIAFANRRPPAQAVSVPTPTIVTARPWPQRAARGRTLLMAPEIFASEGGIPRILRLYLRALCDTAGPNRAVRLLALNDRTMDRADLDRYANDRLESWEVCERDKTRYVWAALRLSRGCDKIVCGHIAQLPVAWLAKQLNRKLRYQLVAHGIEVWHPFTRTEKLALRGAERILCVSDFTRRELLKHCPLPEGRAVVLYNALDPFFPIEPGVPLPTTPPVVLMVTRLTVADRYKGAEHLVAAFPAVRAAVPGARLRIVGRGDDLVRLQGLAAGLGLGAAAEFLGFVDDMQLSEELRSCRLFALPSKKEGFGLVFLEAMAHGRPCLGARAGGIPEVITPESGVLVEYGDVPALAAACVSALRREWDETAILDRARHFSYPQFKIQLAAAMRG